MSVHLEPEAAASCVRACGTFARAIAQLNSANRYDSQIPSAGSFDTAKQIGTVYSLFTGADLQTLLSGFTHQADAMSALFSVAGGLIEAQDEAVASALGKAAAEPAGLQSVGFMTALAALNGPAESALAFASAAGAADSPDVGGYDRVGPEDVSATPLERIVTAAEALDSNQFAQVQQQVSAAASALDSAASTLRFELGDILGGSWQGEFAQQGTAMAEALTGSAFDLVGVLDEVATRADGAQAGFETTRSRISSDAALLTLEQANTPGLGSGPGAALGPPSPGAAEAAAAARAAAEEQARAVVNTEYSPSVMDANLDDLIFPTAFRVVSGTALGGPNGVDPVAAWNIGGVPQTAGAAAPGPAALAAAGIGAGTGGTDGSGAGGTGPGAASAPVTPTDAATEQALLASRAGAGESAGLGATSGAGGTAAGTGGAGGPVNAATTAAGAPMAPMHGATGQQTGGAGASGIRGLRTTGARDRDRGFGSAAGLVGGGGAAAAGAGASRMGGAGTLAGLGGAAGPGGGVPSAGAPGAGAGTASGATAGAGGMGTASSSSGPTAAGRPGAMPMGMMGAGAAGQGSDRRGHTPAGYLTNATNTTEIIGEPAKVAPSVLGRKPDATAETTPTADTPDASTQGRVLGRNYTGSGAEQG